jgi:hypothetical protein
MGIKNWSLTLKEEHMLRVFQNRVLRGIFGRKRGGDREWRELHIYNVEQNDLYCSPNTVLVIKSGRIRSVWLISYRGEDRCIQGLGGET